VAQIAAMRGRSVEAAERDLRRVVGAFGAATVEGAMAAAQRLGVIPFTH
jgi:hypothetical protein